MKHLTQFFPFSFQPCACASVVIPVNDSIFGVILLFSSQLVDHVLLHVIYSCISDCIFFVIDSLGTICLANYGSLRFLFPMTFCYPLLFYKYLMFSGSIFFSRWGFVLRIVMLLLVAWMTLLIFNSLLIVVPVTLGRALFNALPLLPTTHGIKCNGKVIVDVC